MMIPFCFSCVFFRVATCFDCKGANASKYVFALVVLSLACENTGMAD